MNSRTAIAAAIFGYRLVHSQGQRPPPHLTVQATDPIKLRLDHDQPRGWAPETRKEH
jgi:hypothetical protein